MAQAIMDPDEVRRFAEELKRFNLDLQNRMAALQARFTALGDSWQDQEHEKFGEEFVSTMKVLKKFVEFSEKHTPFLLRKAQRTEVGHIRFLRFDGSGHYLPSTPHCFTRSASTTSA